jgi:Skp family chaperone for outer membrane proteins
MSRASLLLALFTLGLSFGCGSGSQEEPNGSDTITTTSIDTSTGLSEIDTSFAVDVDTAGSDSQRVPAEFKIGHIYSAEILLVSPKRVAADKKLEEYGKQLEAEIARSYKDYETKYTKLMTDSSLTEARQQALVNELASLETTIQKLQYSGQEDLLKKKEELYQPILDEINTVIKRVAKTKDYTYIIDASQGSLVYGLDSYDITPMVKRALGLK